MRQALLVVSFGTTVPKAKRDIEGVEKALAALVPGMDVFQAYTSSIIRKKLAGRGEPVFSVEDALEHLADQGYTHVYLQPTHLLPGVEYAKIRRAVHRFPRRKEFEALVMGEPLLPDNSSLLELAGVIARCYVPEEGALVLMGHGSDSFANLVYPALQTVLRLTGVERTYVGTVEGWPELDEVMEQLKTTPHRQVKLVPLMLVAGDHAINDMAGDEPDSWKRRLEAAGYTVSCHLDGLGSQPEIQAMYQARLRALLEGH